MCAHQRMDDGQLFQKGVVNKQKKKETCQM
jgi:hypothetical protein